LWFAALYNTVAVPVAILGAVTPLIAAALMSVSSLIVTLNALRAERSAPHERAHLSRADGDLARADRAVRIPLGAEERPIQGHRSAALRVRTDAMWSVSPPAAG